MTHVIYDKIYFTQTMKNPNFIAWGLFTPKIELENKRLDFPIFQPLIDIIYDINQLRDGR